MIPTAFSVLMMRGPDPTTRDPERLFVLIYDDGGPFHVSVTNAVEAVVRDVYASQRLDEYQVRPRLIYRDSDGQWDGIAVRNGEFVGFVGLGAREPEDAIYKALMLGDRFPIDRSDQNGGRDAV